MFLGFNADRFVNEKYKVLFTGLYLRGPAFEWFNTFFQNFLNNNPKNKNDTINVITQNFLHLKERMQQVFEDFDKEHTTKRKMQVLQQTGLAAEYAFKFQQYTVQTQWEEVLLVAQFYKRLKDRVKDNLVQTYWLTQL